MNPALTPNRDRFGDEIICDNDFWGSQVVKKVGSKRAPKKNPIPTRDPPEPQPREGGRGKDQPSQLEDWKNLKPKPPQPRGLVGFIICINSSVLLSKFIILQVLIAKPLFLFLKFKGLRFLYFY